MSVHESDSIMCLSDSEFERRRALHRLEQHWEVVVGEYMNYISGTTDLGL